MAELPRSENIEAYTALHGLEIIQKEDTDTNISLYEEATGDRYGPAHIE